MTTEIIEQINTKQAELATLIANLVKAATAPAPAVIVIEPNCTSIELQPGEHYAGAVLDADGNHLHHLVLMAAKPDGEVNWQTAMVWANGIGGVLPNRQEQALLYANCKPHLEGRWHWSSESHTDASYAWYCYFTSGGQHDGLKSYEGCAVAVRRV